MKDKNSEVEILGRFNISAFCDEWGPEKVIQVYDPQTGMTGILIIDNTGDPGLCSQLWRSHRVLYRIY